MIRKRRGPQRIPYRHILSCYVSSGMDIHYMCYINASKKDYVYYPYITYYQQYVFRAKSILLPAEQAQEYVLSLPDFYDERNHTKSKPIDDFDFFCQEFGWEKLAEDFRGPKRLHPGVAHFVAVIASGEAKLILLQHGDELIVGDNGDTNAPINCQRELMKRLVGYESPYYRLWYHNNNVCLLFGEPFTAEVLEDLLSFSFAGLDLSPFDVLSSYFIKYLCYQPTEIITRTLNTILINSRIVDKSLWSMFIISELKRRTKYEGIFTQQQQTGFQTIIDFCLPYIREAAGNKSDSKPEKDLNQKVAFFDLGSSLDELNDEFDVLVSGGYLPVDTNRNDFLYYFGGSDESEKAGEPLTPPEKKLKWTGKSQKIFGLFLDSLGVDETWKTASEVFDSVNVGSLKTAISTYKKKKKVHRSEDAEMIRSTEQELSGIIFK